MKPTEHTELNAWIALNVMGYICKSRQSKDSSSVTEHFWFESGNDIEPMHKCLTQAALSINYPEDMPEYTTDTASAIEVLKKCVSKLSSDLGVGVTIITTGEKMYRVEASHNPFDAVIIDTLELAICLFAKKLFLK